MVSHNIQTKQKKAKWCCALIVDKCLEYLCQKVVTPPCLHTRCVCKILFFGACTALCTLCTKGSGRRFVCAHDRQPAERALVWGPLWHFPSFCRRWMF